MIKCKYFYSTTEHDSNGFGMRIHSPMFNFNQWDQKDVQRIHSINPTYNTNGECVQILVFYETDEHIEE